MLNKKTHKTITKPIVVIYHAGCPDGFAAALALRLYFSDQVKEQDISYFPGKHGFDAPECTGKEVFIVDFSYHRANIIELCQQAHHVTIIDHHISAQKELDKLENEIDNLSIHFDMSHSGAVLSWMYFFNSPPPLLFNYVEDRDIWKFELENTNEIMLAITSYPYDFELWNSWVEDENKLAELLYEGQVLTRSKDQMIQKYAKSSYIGNIAGYQVPIVNAPSSIGSDLLQLLSHNYPFAASYEDREDRRSWQLRSSGEQGIDVSEIAQLFGGGGHQRASGFATALEKIALPKP